MNTFHENRTLYILLYYADKEWDLENSQPHVVSSPDPTYEREGLVTSSWYLGLH